jgi:hypothetical protein
MHARMAVTHTQPVDRCTLQLTNRLKVSPVMTSTSDTLEMIPHFIAIDDAVLRANANHITLVHETKLAFACSLSTARRYTQDSSSGAQTDISCVARHDID